MHKCPHEYMCIYNVPNSELPPSFEGFKFADNSPQVKSVFKTRRFITLLYASLPQIEYRPGMASSKVSFVLDDDVCCVSSKVSFYLDEAGCVSSKIYFFLDDSIRYIKK